MEDLVLRIIRHEGFKSFPYQDTLGHWTIGCGHCITEQTAKNSYPNGISYKDAIGLLEADLDAAKLAVARELPWTLGMDELRLGILVEMTFQLGIAGVLRFVKMLNAIRNQDWETAAEEMLDSLWVKQAPYRAQELANLMENGYNQENSST